MEYRRGLEAGTGSTSSEPILVNDVVYWTGFGGQVGAAKIIRDNQGEVSGCEDLWVADVSDLLGFNVQTTEPSVRVSKVDNSYRLVSHNKGGAIFVLDLLTGNKYYNIDLCVGSALGGVHWGVSYNPDTEDILATCSGGSLDPLFGLNLRYRQVLADGTETCSTGFLNAIDIRTGELKWQSVAAQAVPLMGCPTTGFEPDLRFKSGLNFTYVYRNKPDASVSVNYLPTSPDIPVQVEGEARMHGRATSAGGMLFVPALHGTAYVLKDTDGTYLNQLHCDQGGLYQGISVARDTLSFGCGYEAFTPDLEGTSIMVFSLDR